MNTKQPHNSAKVMAAVPAKPGDEAAGRSCRHLLKFEREALTVAHSAGLLLRENVWAARIENELRTALGTEDSQARARAFRAQRSKGQQSFGNCQLVAGVASNEWGHCALFFYRSDFRCGKPPSVNASGELQAYPPPDLIGSLFTTL